jgi:hypothetical protein
VHNEERHNLYSSPNIIDKPIEDKMDKTGGTHAREA